ncbi:hypothetical protein KEM56_005715, partial [Ascosphaera pollenicola]
MAYQHQHQHQHQHARPIQSPGIVHDLTASPLQATTNLSLATATNAATAGTGSKGSTSPPMKLAAHANGSSGGGSGAHQVVHLTNKVGMMENELKACWNGVRNLAVRFDNLTSEPIVRCMSEKLLE